MANVSVYNMEGAEVGTMELSDAIFGVEIKPHLIHRAVILHLANMRQGTQKSKGRSEVSGGGRKPWRQKGTGHARQGSIRAAQWKGGGMIFPVSPRDYSFKMNRREKRSALLSALTAKVQDGTIIVVDSLALENGKTKEMAKVLANLKAGKSLIVTEGTDMNVVLAARNIPEVKTINADLLNTYDVMNYRNLIVTQDAVRKIEEVYA
ncbi:MAG: 50S ribosomal protein L4 [Lachnospiraceae bacterium]|nr:50S ribosomal protein L4 [Lachnospiraceae bacterium]MBQ6545706.1 50S ribosomal protein L4 [Lachnospiraceae bacterium]